MTAFLLAAAAALTSASMQALGRVYLDGRTSVADGYEGWFYWDSTNRSALVTLDNAQGASNRRGIFIPAADDMSGASGGLTRDGAIGAVAFYAPWFGFPIASNTSIDSAPALQACINIAQYSDAGAALPEAITFKTLSTVSMKYGVSSGRRYFAYLSGNNCKWFHAADSVALFIDPQCVLASSGTGDGISRFNIRDLEFNSGLLPMSRSSARALQVGKAGYVLDAFVFSELHNIFCGEAFEIQPLLFQNARHWIGTAICTRGANSGGIGFVATDPGAFCGDCTIDGELSGSSANRPLSFFAAGSVAGEAEVRGIRVNCAIYGGGTSLSTGDYGKIGDIWFEDGHQFEGNYSGDNALEISQNGSTSSGAIFNVFLVQPYIAGFTGAAVFIAGTPAAGIWGEITILGGSVGYVSPTGGGAVISCFGDIPLRVFGTVFRHSNALCEVRLFGSNSMKAEIIAAASYDGVLSTNAAFIVDNTAEDCTVSSCRSDQPNTVLVVSPASSNLVFGNDLGLFESNQPFRGPLYQDASGDRVVGARKTAIGALTITATSGVLPTPDGTVTFANAASPTNAELLDAVVDLGAKIEAIRARLGATTGHGLTAD